VPAGDERVRSPNHRAGCLMPSTEPIEVLLQRWERALLEPQARKSPLVERLLADDFVELGSSGRRFDRAQAVAALRAEIPVEVTASDFEVRLLSSEIALVTYRARRHGAPPVDTLRSSIWQVREGRWQMVFHQGTPAAGVSRSER